MVTARIHFIFLHRFGKRIILAGCLCLLPLNYHLFILLFFTDRHAEEPFLGSSARLQLQNSFTAGLTLLLFKKSCNLLHYSVFEIPFHLKIEFDLQFSNKIHYFLKNPLFSNFISFFSHILIDFMKSGAILVR